MQYKRVSLYDLTKLSDNPALCKKYVRYLCGFKKSSEYRHQEIVGITALLTHLSLSKSDAEGFVSGYTVPQLSKEFDLIKTSENCCVNVELKSLNVGLARIKKQLLQNKYYLGILGKRDNYFFTYVTETDKLYKLDGEQVSECSFGELRKVLKGLKSDDADLNEAFKPKNILVSPLNNTSRFLAGRYLLTQSQQTTKSQLTRFLKSKSDVFVGLTGGAGTGKTLLVYDLAKQIGQKQKVLVIHVGPLCLGHIRLGKHLCGVTVVSVDDKAKINGADYDVVIVDEAQRLPFLSLNDIAEKSVKKGAKCVFSYDKEQTLFETQEFKAVCEKIDELCGNSVFKLTNRVRTNEQLSLFVSCLLNLSRYKKEYRFDDVKVIFEPDKQKAVARAKSLKEYTYISFLSKRANTTLNALAVIGQEFENVCMVVDDDFYYDGDKLQAKNQPDPEYVLIKMLFQGLTRVRSKLAIIVTQREVLDKILSLF